MKTYGLGIRLNKPRLRQGGQGRGGFKEKRMKKEVLRRAIKDAPCPVRFVKEGGTREKEIVKEWGFRPYAWYHYSPATIYILRNCPNYQTLGFLYHEWGHHLRPNLGGGTTAEYWAVKYTLQRLLKEEHYHTLLNELRLWRRPDNATIHIIAYKKLVKTKLWKDCVKAVRKWRKKK